MENKLFMESRLSVVFDVTKWCPWDCAICCMGATADRERCGDELTFEEKLSAVDQIAEVRGIRDVRIDFSGGEIFMDRRNLRVIEYAAGLLGREKIGISTSGYGMDDAAAELLSRCVSDCEMTMDTVPGQAYRLRPRGYAMAAAAAVPLLKKHGVSVGIQTVLAHSNCNEEMLRGIYEWLCGHGVDCWSLLKFYPSGRGAGFKEEVPGREEEAWAVRFITEMREADPSGRKPKIDFHYTMAGHWKYSRECRCVKKSIGILPNGDVTSCFWAVDADTGVTAPKFLLGNVREEKLADLLRGEKAAYWLNCSHQCELDAA